MGILQAVMVASTMLLVMFAWQLTFELEVLNNATAEADADKLRA